MQINHNSGEMIITIAIGQLKPVKSKGEIIGVYTLRDDGCYEAAKVYLDDIRGLVAKTCAFDEITEAKKWMLKAG